MVADASFLCVDGYVCYDDTGAERDVPSSDSGVIYSDILCQAMNMLTPFVTKPEQSPVLQASGRDAFMSLRRAVLGSAEYQISQPRKAGPTWIESLRSINQAAKGGG